MHGKSLNKRNCKRKMIKCIKSNWLIGSWNITSNTPCIRNACYEKRSKQIKGKAMIAVTKPFVIFILETKGDPDGTLIWIYNWWDFRNRETITTRDIDQVNNFFVYPTQLTFTHRYWCVPIIDTSYVFCPRL